MNKYFAVVLCLVLLLGCAGTASATKVYYEDGWKVTDTSMDPPNQGLPNFPDGTTWRNPNEMAPTPKRISIYVNGMPLFPDVDPYLDSNDRTMVPVRAITEALNSTVSWDGTDGQGKVQIMRKGKELNLWINNKQAMVDGEPLDMDTNPVVRNNRTMVPARFVAQAFAAEVLWSEGNQMVSITLND